MAKVFLGVGHGGTDPGASGNRLKEKDLNLAIALSCRDVLTRHGVTVGMSRTTDENDTLPDEISECNAFGPKLAVDIHNNAGGGDGVEVFHHIGGGVSKELAQNIIDRIIDLGQNSRGIKTRTLSNGADYYGFIRETKSPAVIVECAFIDNAKDIQIIDTAAEQKAMGEAIAKGILDTLKIAYVPLSNKTDSKPAAALDNTPDKYAEKAVAWAKDKKILRGDNRGDLMLHKEITRQDVITFLYRALNG